jgi:hypothetical protein
MLSYGLYEVDHLEDIVDQINFMRLLGYKDSDLLIVIEDSIYNMLCFKHRLNDISGFSNYSFCGSHLFGIEILIFRKEGNCQSEVLLRQDFKIKISGDGRRIY